ncbi:MAG: tyrosine-type recombinase/integrase [Polaromonas sp.]|nr:tyrosine-type recombinase/integrase [Polaromonas sp.]
MHLTLGFLHVTLKYTYPRGGTIIYQRAVPKSLWQRYPGKTVKHDLKTADLTEAERAVAVLNKRYETEWAGLKAAPNSSPAALTAHADAFLKVRGLRPGVYGNDPLAIELLHDEMDTKRMRHASGDEERYRAATADSYLSPVEQEAGRRLHGVKKPTLQDALDLHISVHKKRDKASFVTYQRRAFKTLSDVTDNKDMADFTRSDARAYVEAALKATVATGTVRRRLGAIAAVFTTWRLERDPQHTSPFEKLAIPGEGEDKKARVPFTTAELSTLEALCRYKDDDVRWALALLADTGARLAEVIGLKMSDISLNGEVPHIIIQPHPWRPLKTSFSARSVPLVGIALWGAKRIVETAREGQELAFPRYTSATECRATAASGALTSWIRRKGLDHVPHELRHTMADRLRDVQCPKDIRYAIDGHAAQDVGDDYGTGFGLKVKAGWLSKIVLGS